MDLNYLLSRHQFSIHRADTAVSPEARHAHRGMAQGYAGMIQALQLTLGARAVLIDTI